MGKRCLGCGTANGVDAKSCESYGTLIAGVLLQDSGRLLALRTLIGMLLFSSFVAVVSAQSTPDRLQQRLRQSLGRGANNAQLVAELKQHSEFEFLIANQGINFFLKKNTISTGPGFSHAVVMAIHQKPAMVNGQYFVGSTFELQIRCASREFRAVKETALNAELKSVEGVIAPTPAVGFAPFGPSSVPHETYLRLCAAYEAEQAARKAASERSSAERAAAAKAAARAAAETDAARRAASSRAAEAASTERAAEPATSGKGQSGRPRPSAVEEPQKPAPIKPRSPMDL